MICSLKEVREISQPAGQHCSCSYVFHEDPEGRVAQHRILKRQKVLPRGQDLAVAHVLPIHREAVSPQRPHLECAAAAARRRGCHGVVWAEVTDDDEGSGGVVKVDPRGTPLPPRRTDITTHYVVRDSSPHRVQGLERGETEPPPVPLARPLVRDPLHSGR